MRAKMEVPAVGSVFGTSTVVGPADVERVKGVLYCKVECWSCKKHRDVQVGNLIRGMIKRCVACRWHRKSVIRSGMARGPRQS